MKKRIGIIILLCLWSYSIYFVFIKDESMDVVKADAKVVDVILDAGHGGHDPGGQGAGVYEKDITLDVTLKVGKQLEAKGLKVAYTRDQDEALGDTEKEDLQKRVDITNAMNAKYFISIHTNASEVPESSTGFEIWMNKQSALSTTLAYFVGEELDSLQYADNRGSMDGKDLYVIKNVKIPSILIELGFLNTTQDVSYLKVEKNRQAIAEKIADGIVRGIEKEKVVKK